ncbi:FAD-binding protein [Paracoccus contaminans]|uniref:FAD-binding PCMH-type domain-containing protein n=1 Tax=Paracoccus contaminans TaxID=1945662 RepID=A0A1W6CZ18_9RHOB|nr:FAD-binding protein [Paracoccus contaminans]ARJ70117.1 hypothetical protein B0A89_11245 [Paracoccus contaminans]
MRPESESEIAAILRTARAPLTIIGGGTRSRPASGDVLSTRGLTGITLYEPAAMTLIARAGTPLAEIEAALAAENQRLAFEPPNRADAWAGGDPRDGEDVAPGARREASTIGGVIAANASGPRRIQSGAARDSLIGLRFVDGTGEVIANGGRVMKNVTGYDLVKLMAGSRGMLGVLTEVALRTAPVPPASVTLMLRCPAQRAVPAMTAALTGPWDISGAGWLPDLGVVLRLEGLPGSVALRARTLSARLEPFGAAGMLDEAAAAWRRLGALAAGWGPGAEDMAEDMAEGAVWRILCRPSQVDALLAANGGHEPLAMDWGGGLVILPLPAGALPALPPQARARRLSGAMMDLPLPDPVTARLNEGLRARFDPRGILAGAI